jgi:hypothetical protein
VKDRSGIERIVLNGCEASGFVSGETALVPYSAVKVQNFKKLQLKKNAVWDKKVGQSGGFSYSLELLYCPFHCLIRSH